MVEDGPGGGRLRGGGDVTTRLKWNLWGNDGGDTALALLPYATFPGGGDVGGSELQGGLAVPFSTSAGDVSVGLMASFDAVYDDDADRHRLEVLHTAVAGFELAERTGAYLEYAGTAGPGDYRASVNLGLTRALSRDAVVDVGARVGAHLGRRGPRALRRLHPPVLRGAVQRAQEAAGRLRSRSRGERAGPSSGGGSRGAGLGPPDPTAARPRR